MGWNWVFIKRRKVLKYSLILKYQHSLPDPENQSALTSRYANIGYTSSAPQYRSAYRQSNFPTISSSASSSPSHPLSSASSSSLGKNAVSTTFPPRPLPPQIQLHRPPLQLDTHSQHTSISPKYPTPAHLSYLRPQLLYDGGEGSSFSTSSLDRRQLPSLSVGRHRAMAGGVTEGSTHFPVTDTCRPMEPADLRRFGKSVSATPHTGRFQCFPHSDQSCMERLLATIHSRAGGRSGGEGGEGLALVPGGTNTTTTTTTTAI